MTPKRMHPLMMVYSIIRAVKNTAILIIYLFILRWNDQSFISKYGRIAFVIGSIFYIISIILKWWSTTYMFQGRTIHLSRGILKQTKSHMSLERVQNIKTSMPFYYKPFGLTSMTLETSTTKDGATFSFEAITLDEAQRIEAVVNQVQHEKEQIRQRTIQSESSPVSEASLSIDRQESEVPSSEFRESDQSLEGIGPQNQALSYDGEHVHASIGKKNKTVHFRPTRRDLIRASFLSLSFLVVIPIMITALSNLEDFVNIEAYFQGFYQTIRGSWLLIALLLFLLVLILIGIGIVWTFLKYGKHEIASDKDYIYIRTGALSEHALTIQKKNVQAVKISQNPLKNWLRLCAVKLVSAESETEDHVSISVLYPYLPIDKAYQLIEDLLPNMTIQKDWQRLPKRALTVKMLRFPFWTLLASCIILWWRINLWWIIPILFVVTYCLRWFDYRNTRFLFNAQGLQFKKGGLWSNVFISNRQKVIDIHLTSSFLQQKFGLASIRTTNRTKPIYVETLWDIPMDVAQSFIQWYGGRINDIRIKHSRSTQKSSHADGVTKSHET